MGKEGTPSYGRRQSDRELLKKAAQAEKKLRDERKKQYELRHPLKTKIEKLFRFAVVIGTLAGCGSLAKPVIERVATIPTAVGCAIDMAKRYNDIRTQPMNDAFCFIIDADSPDPAHKKAMNNIIYKRVFGEMTCGPNGSVLVKGFVDLRPGYFLPDQIYPGYPYAAVGCENKLPFSRLCAFGPDSRFSENSLDENGITMSGIYYNPFNGKFSGPMDISGAHLIPPGVFCVEPRK